MSAADIIPIATLSVPVSVSVRTPIGVVIIIVRSDGGAHTSTHIGSPAVADGGASSRMNSGALRRVNGGTSARMNRGAPTGMHGSPITAVGHGIGLGALSRKRQGQQSRQENNHTFHIFSVYHIKSFLAIFVPLRPVLVPAKNYPAASTAGSRRG